MVGLVDHRFAMARLDAPYGYGGADGGVVTVVTARKFANRAGGNFRILRRSGEFGLYTRPEHCRICQHELFSKLRQASSRLVKVGQAFQPDKNQ
jgi:hypothetical protein